MARIGPVWVERVVPINGNFSNFEGAYLGKYWRPNKNERCSELLSSPGMFPQKIMRIGVLTVNCSFSVCAWHCATSEPYGLEKKQSAFPALPFSCTIFFCLPVSSALFSVFLQLNCFLNEAWSFALLPNTEDENRKADGGGSVRFGSRPIVGISLDYTCTWVCVWSSLVQCTATPPQKKKKEA